MKSCSNCKYKGTFTTKKPCKYCMAADGRVRLFSMWEPERKQTNYEKIMAEMTVPKLAMRRTHRDYVNAWWGESNPEKPYATRGQALRAEIEWLMKEVDEPDFDPMLGQSESEVD